MEVERKALHSGNGEKLNVVVFDAVPEYALAYMAYGDSSGLSDGDVRIIDKWMSDNNLDHLVDSGEERFFSFRPEFGLASTCVKATFSERSVVQQKAVVPEKKQESAVERDSGGIEY